MQSGLDPGPLFTRISSERSHYSVHDLSCLLVSLEFANLTRIQHKRITLFAREVGFKHVALLFENVKISTEIALFI